MNRLQFLMGAFPTITALSAIALLGAAGATGATGATGTVTVDEPAFTSPTTLAAVAAAFLLGLLIVAVVRRADR
jgi:hypothetical protein